MKIGLDYVATIGRGGNSRYSNGLIRALSEIDMENEYYLYGFFHDYFLGRKDRTFKPNFKFKAGYFSSLNLPISGSFIRKINNVLLPKLARHHKIQVFHFTNPLNFVPNISQSIITIHDLISFYDPTWTREEHRKNWYNSNLASILTNSSGIIAVSNSTKNDIMKKFNIKESKIKVIYEAAESIFYPDEDFEYVAEKFNLDKYILYVGQLQPRKNIVELLLVYNKIDPALRRKYKLVLVGGARDQEFLDQIESRIRELKIENNVIHLRDVTDKDLRKLYSCAKIFLFPTLYEGFGLPVIEALQCGTPVVASNTSSLPEVVGEAGILVDPYNSEDIKNGLENILSEEKIYQVLKQKCVGQASKFSWSKAAKETLAAYQEFCCS